LCEVRADGRGAYRLRWRLATTALLDGYLGVASPRGLRIGLRPILGRFVGSAKARRFRPPARDGKLIQLEISRRTGIDLKDQTNKIKELHKGIDSVIATALANQASASLDDPIREELDSLLAGKIGTRPASQQELEAACADGERRYAQSRPPGSKDARDKKDIRYVFDGLEYQAQYGDYLLWRQLIAHCGQQGLKSIILVTSDSKEDWWQLLEGKSIGPHPELSAEIKKIAGVALFWMYEASNFLKYAKEFTGADVKDKSIRGARDIEEELVQRGGLLGALLGGSHDSSQTNALAELARRREDYDVSRPVLDWLEREHPDAARLCRAKARHTEGVFANLGSATSKPRANAN